MRAWLLSVVTAATPAAVLPFARMATGAGAPAPDVVVTARATAARYSHPTALPLRTPARISCVKSNCRLADGRVYHGDWAVDFLGDFGDPVYAAGYGVAHVGGRLSGCRANPEQRRGNWVWIDHGAGEVTNYYHLQSIAVTRSPGTPPC